MTTRLNENYDTSAKWGVNSDLHTLVTEKKSELEPVDEPRHVAKDATAPLSDLPEQKPRESGGQAGPEPTRYGDWEKKGRCTDF